MTMKETLAIAKAMREQTAAAYKQGAKDALDNKLEHSMSDAILKQIREESYKDGVVSALSELREVYGAELELTDLWGSYMKEEVK